MNRDTLFSCMGRPPGGSTTSPPLGAAPVGLMDGDQLVALLIENDMYISRQTHDIIQLEAQEEEDD